MWRISRTGRLSCIGLLHGGGDGGSGIRAGVGRCEIGSTTHAAWCVSAYCPGRSYIMSGEPAPPSLQHDTHKFVCPQETEHMPLSTTSSKLPRLVSFALRLLACHRTTTGSSTKRSGITHSVMCFLQGGRHHLTGCCSRAGLWQGVSAHAQGREQSPRHCHPCPQARDRCAVPAGLLWLCCEIIQELTWLLTVVVSYSSSPYFRLSPGLKD